MPTILRLAAGTWLRPAAAPAPAVFRRAGGPRQVAHIVNISSIAGRVAWNGYGVYNFTKFGVNGFTESLRQEIPQRALKTSLVRAAVG